MEKQKVTKKELAGLFGSIEPKYLGEVIPAGYYNLKVVKAEVVAPKEGADEPAFSTKLTIVVMDGEQEGRTIFHRLFLTEKGLPFTVGLVQKILGGMPDELARIDPSDTEELATALAEALDGREFYHEVVVEKPRKEDEGKYGEQNRLGMRKSRR